MIIEELKINVHKHYSNDIAKIAVALINEPQVDKLIKDCQNSNVQIVTGTDLNIRPVVLRKLFDSGFDVRISKNSNPPYHFHPKVYLFSNEGGTWNGYVGSANLTTGGMSKNIEMSVEVTEEQALELVNWFNELFISSDQLTTKFIESYETSYKKKKQWHDKIREEDDRNNELNRENHKRSSREVLIKNIEYILRESSEDEILNNKGWDATKEILSTLDAQNEYSNPDLDAFFSISQLGKIVGMNKPKISLDDLTTALQSLDKQDDLYNQFQKIEQVKYVGKNIASKILCSKYPMDAFVWNDVSDILLRRHDIYPTKRLNKQDNFKFLNNEVQSIAKEVNVKSMVAMDYLFYQLVSLSWNEYWTKLKKYDKLNIIPASRTFHGKENHSVYIKSKNNIKLYINGDSDKDNPSLYVNIDFTGSLAKEDFHNFKKLYENQVRAMFPNEIIEYDSKPNEKQALVRIRKFVDLFDRTAWENQFEWLITNVEKLLKFI